MNYKIITNNKETLEIDIKRQASFEIILCTGFLIIGLVGVSLNLLYEIIQAPYKLDEQIVIIIVTCIFAGLYAGKLFLWNLRGKENIKLKENTLIIRRKGTILSVARKYELTFIEKFSTAGKSPYPRWMRMFGIAGGQIEFSYLSEPRYFGQTLSQTESQQIIEMIETRIYTKPVEPQLI